MKPNRFWTAILFLTLGVIMGMFHPSKAHAEVQAIPQEDSTIIVTCTGTQKDLVIAECKQAWVKSCPQGGVVIDAKGSVPESGPIVLVTLIKCTTIIDNSI